MESQTECMRCKRFFEKTKLVSYHDGYFICRASCAKYFCKERFAAYKTRSEEPIRADPMRPVFSDDLVECSVCLHQIRKRYAYVASGPTLQYICSDPKNHGKVPMITPEDFDFKHVSSRSTLSILSDNISTYDPEKTRVIEEFIEDHDILHLLEVLQAWDMKGRPTLLPTDFEDEGRVVDVSARVSDADLDFIADTLNLTDKQLEALKDRLRPEVNVPEKSVRKMLVEPTAEECAEYVGMTLEEAERKAENNGNPTRVVCVDGDSFIITSDLRRHRLNFTVEDGKVVGCKNY